MLKTKGEILFISCYELGHQPLGLAYPIAFLERAGFQSEAIDLSVQKLDMEQVRRARFIGISVPMHTALRIGTEVAFRIRESNPSCHISFYGLYASLNADTLLEGVADSVIGGEYEIPLLSLVQALASKKENMVEEEILINGVSTKRQSARPFMSHLPFPVPSRSLLPPLSNYAHLEEKGLKREAAYVEASRGCRYHCTHCPIPPVYDGRFFIIPEKVVMSDRAQIVEIGATHITFGDPDFLNGPVHSLRVVRSLHKAFPDLTFDFTAKVEHLLRYQTLLPEFSSMGCLFIISAIESLNDAVLRHLAKGHTRADAIQAIHLTQNAGIALRPSLVPFTPWTTLEDLVDLFQVIEAEGMIGHVDPVQYSIRLLIPPGSLLLSANTGSCLGPLDAPGFTYRWTHPDPRIDQIQRLFLKEIEIGMQEGKEPEILFYQLKEMIQAVLENRDAVQIEKKLQKNQYRAPRLTESWFCCSEPMDSQLSCLQV
ncbi:MAG: CUAEP/CCAEP-tail radical SAM (seleno)protein [Nitrospiria bacterium]